MNLTLDANIWVIASDFSDPRHAVCRDLLNTIVSTPDISVCSPYLMEVEVLSSVARKTRNIAKIHEAGEMLQSLPRHYWYALNSKLAAYASRCATMLFLRGADAVYVATAVSYNAILITYDEEIIDRASSALPVVKPLEWLEKYA